MNKIIKKHSWIIIKIIISEQDYFILKQEELRHKQEEQEK